jgi:hypothetical protein
MKKRRKEGICSFYPCYYLSAESVLFYLYVSRQHKKYIPSYSICAENTTDLVL